MPLVRLRLRCLRWANAQHLKARTSAAADEAASPKVEGREPARRAPAAHLRPVWATAASNSLSTALIAVIADAVERNADVTPCRYRIEAVQLP